MAVALVGGRGGQYVEALVGYLGQGSMKIVDAAVRNESFPTFQQTF
jgi:hypothetical protein